MHTALRVPIVVVAPQQWDAGCARSSFSMFAAPRRYGIVSRASSETEVTTKETPSSTSAQTGTGPSGDDPSSSGRIIAGMAVAAGVALFFSTKLANPGPSLAALEQDAIPLDVALRNGKPTVMEFYAGKCQKNMPEPLF